MKKIALLSLFFAFALSVNGQTEREITPSPLLGSRTDTTGVVFLNNETPTLVGEIPRRVADFRSISAKRGNTYEIIPVNPNAFRLTGFQVDYHGGLGLSAAGKMPELHGQNNFDEQKDFFRKGFSFQNSVSTKFGFTNREVVELAFGQNRMNNPVPHSNQTNYNALLRAENFRFGKFTTDFGVLGSSRDNRLTNFGASHARLFNAVLTDNFSEFPYRELPDNSNTQDLLTYLRTNFRHRDFSSTASLSFNKQWDERTMGIFAPVAVPPLLRNEELSDLRAALSSNYRLRLNWRHHFDFQANYSFNRTDNVVERMNTTVFDGFRNAHEIIYGVSYNYHYINGITIDLRNKHYFSNTAQNYTNFFPTAGVAIHSREILDEILDMIFWNGNFWVDNFNIFGSAGRSLGEASLIHRDYSVFTTEMSSVAALNNFYENREIFSQTRKMTPEIYENYEVGFQISFGTWTNRRSNSNTHNTYNLQFTYFNNTTRNMIAPRADAGQFFLQNIGDVRNDGFLIDASYSRRFDRDRTFTFNVIFSRLRNEVLNVADGYEKVALAGFSDVGAFFAKGEPLGAIFGTTYLRTGTGAIMTDDNGLPLIDSELRKIGNPIPNFTLGFSPNLSLRKFDFSLLLEHQNGGERWNGTRQFLENSPARAADDYIESASFWRLSQVAASYNIIQNRNDNIIRNLKIGVSAQNLFIVAPYTGVAPMTNLFGYATGANLDFFNMPVLRSYQFFVNIKF